MNIKHKYESLPVQVKASIWFLMCSFLQRGISMITTPIFTRIMTPNDYGELGVFNSWQGIISIIVALGLTGGVHTQGLVKFEHEEKKFSSSLQGLNLTLVILWFIIYCFFSRFWNSLFTLSSVQMISMFILIWISAVFAFWANEQRVHYSYKILVTVTLISSVFKPIVEIILVCNSTEKATARIVGNVICDIFIFGWMFFYQIRAGKSFFSKKYWGYALAFNIPLVPHYLSQTVLSSADRIMIQKMVGESETGIYNLAYSVSLIMTIFNSVLMQTISPWMYKKIKDKKIEDIAPIAYTTLIMIGAVNLLLIILAPEVISIFAPKSYYEAIWVVPPIAMSVFFMYSYDLFAKFAFYYEKTKEIMFASVVGAVLNIVLNYIFIGIFSFRAAGYTTLTCYIVYAVAHYLFMRKVCRDCCGCVYPYETRTIITIAVPFLGVGFLLMATYNYRMIRYGVVIVAIVAAIILRNKILNIIKRVINVKSIN